ncbi:unnamed protein product [Ascophyllum nodosum]
MRKAGMAGGGKGGAKSTAARSNEVLIESGIATLDRATATDRQGQLEEAFALYQHGIDMLLKGARAELNEHRRQTLLREAGVHMTRAETIKAALAPPAAPASAPARKASRSGQGRGKRALVRPQPSSSDIRGTVRGGKPVISDSGSTSLGSTVGSASSSSYRTGRKSRKSRSPRAAGGGRGGAEGGEVRRRNPENEELEEKILDELLDGSPGVSWDAIAGLDYAKQTLQEAVILPTLRPDLFTGLRAPTKGVLLYGPPGTGKTMLAKAVATESGYAFFNISASSLTQKLFGEGEKMVRALFSVARSRQPAVIFIDEIDSVLSSRGEGEHEASRRLKTEFLVQLDGVGSGDGEEERLLVLAATNLPQELDEAVLRRLSRRVYVPLPDPEARRALLSKLLDKHKASISGARLTSLVEMTEGYSGSDLKELCKEAAMQPIRDLGTKIRTVAAKDVRGINLDDFRAALTRVLPSVSKHTVEKYDEWQRSLSGS